MEKKTYEKSLVDFKEATKHPPDFLAASPKLSKTLQSNLKQLYDFTQSVETKTISKPLNTLNALPELIVKNLDTEQIWQQIELKNNDILNISVGKISRFLALKDTLLFDKSILSKLHFKDEQNKESGFSEEEGSDEAEEDIVEENDMSEDKEGSESEAEETMGKNKSEKKKSIVDDDFFKMSEMEEFLKSEEKKMEGSSKKRKLVNDDEDENDSDEDNSENESIDFFENQEDNEGEKEEEIAKMARFKDYFVQKDEPTTSKKSNKKSFHSDSDDNQSDTETQKQLKSSLDKRQERLSKKIEQLEEEAIGDKPWQLKGEVTAKDRPENSLLENVLDFDLTARPAPVITEQTSLQLEDIIRQRIKDKVFDSVERKIKPVETPLEYKKKLVLDQEKSKESLAQIYEKEYLEQQAALDPEHSANEKEPETHIEIKSMMRELFNKLDALSNFHFSSKPAVPDLKIISNLPAVNMEEVAPVAVSEAALLAPEEIRGKGKGDTIGKSEKTKTDKNRERRKKKLKQKIHAQQKAKKDALRNQKKLISGVPKKYGAKKPKIKNR